jgi:hypothetical protein
LGVGTCHGDLNTQDSPRPELGGSHHLPAYSILCSSPRRLHPNGYFSRDSRVGVPKSRQMGLPGLWSPITLRADLGSQCGLKQSCRSRQDLSNGLSHVLCSQVFRVDSWLLVVRSQNWQTSRNSTPDPSFGHNLCLRYPNEQCEPILDIYVSRSFRWYKERHKRLSFDPCNRSLKFRESTGTPSPQVGVAWGVWGLIPSHFLTLPGVCDVTPGLPLALTPGLPLGLILGLPFGITPGLAFGLTLGLPFGSHPCNSLCLGRKPKARVATLVNYTRIVEQVCSMLNVLLNH